MAALRFCIAVAAGGTCQPAACTCLRVALLAPICLAPQLRQAIDDFLATYNATAAPFEWKKAVRLSS
jgi:hypothetical protein